jgi:hypothetical protein
MSDRIGNMNEEQFSVESPSQRLGVSEGTIRSVRKIRCNQDLGESGGGRKGRCHDSVS